MGDGSVTNPAARATTGRRKRLKGVWVTEEWKVEKAEFLKDYPNCEMHKSVIIKGNPLIVPATVPHHPDKTSYKEGYSDLELSQCVAYCKSCHFAIHHGMKLCPVCGEHYCPWDAPICKRCFDKAHPDIVAKRAESKERYETAQREIKVQASAVDLAEAVKRSRNVVQKLSKGIGFMLRCSRIQKRIYSISNR